MSRLRAFLAASRANLLLASIGHATLGIFLGAATLSDLLAAKVLLYILLHYSIAFLACNINSLADLDVDRRYKRYISDGVQRLGRGMMLAIIGFFLVASVLLLAYFALSGYRATAFLALLGIISAFAYSAGPVRLKGRGALSPVPIFFGLYMLPLLGGWFLFRSDLDPYFIVFVAGYALMNEGYTLVNTCEDYSEDRAEGLRTWAHIFGLRRTLKIAHAMAVLGLLCPASMLLLRFQGHVGELAYGPSLALLAIAAVGLLTLKASAEVGDARRFRDLESGAKLYGKRLQRWFLMTRYPLILAGLLMLL